jgi:signal transduction histidine kinase
MLRQSETIQVVVMIVFIVIWSVDLHLQDINLEQYADVFRDVEYLLSHVSLSCSWFDGLVLQVFASQIWSCMATEMKYICFWNCFFFYQLKNRAKDCSTNEATSTEKN